MAANAPTPDQAVYMQLERANALQAKLDKAEADLAQWQEMYREMMHSAESLKDRLDAVTKQRDTWYEESQRRMLHYAKLADDTQSELIGAREHERQTHERLGVILGTDTSLEDAAQRMARDLAYARKKLEMERYVSDTALRALSHGAISRGRDTKLSAGRFARHRQGDR